MGGQEWALRFSISEGSLKKQNQQDVCGMCWGIRGGFGV
jgi:hypothetical protein